MDPVCPLLEKFAGGTFEAPLALARADDGLTGKACLLSIRANTDLPCEVTAYDWSCNQTHDGARFFEEVASLMFPFPRG
jgi:hypothetical protein